MATKKTQVEQADMPVAKEDMTAKHVPGASPDDVYAQLEAVAASEPAPAPVTQADLPVATKEEAAVNLDEFGGREEGDTVRFGQKVFAKDPDKRVVLPSRENLAAGPRRPELPKQGEFLPGLKSFRGVPYRTKTGSIRVDH